MNKSLKFELSALIVLAVTIIDMYDPIDMDSSVFDIKYSWMISLLGCIVVIGLSITAFVKSIGEIRRRENKAQAVTSLVLSSITGILVPLGIMALFALLLSSGGH